MNRRDFKLGQKIKFSGWCQADPTGIGTVTRIERNRIYFTWTEYDWGNSFTDDSTYLRMTLLEDVILLATEQRVANKCKKLWNNSSYIKKNPSYAY